MLIHSMDMIETAIHIIVGREKEGGVLLGMIHCQEPL